MEIFQTQDTSSYFRVVRIQSFSLCQLFQHFGIPSITKLAFPLDCQEVVEYAVLSLSVVCNSLQPHGL